MPTGCGGGAPTRTGGTAARYSRAAGAERGGAERDDARASGTAVQCHAARQRGAAAGSSRSRATAPSAGRRERRGRLRTTGRPRGRPRPTRRPRRGRRRHHVAPRRRTPDRSAASAAAGRSASARGAARKARRGCMAPDSTTSPRACKFAVDNSVDFWENARRFPHHAPPDRRRTPDANVNDTSTTPSEFLSQTFFVPSLSATDKQGVLAELADVVVARGIVPAADRDAILAALVEREEKRGRGGRTERRSRDRGRGAPPRAGGRVRRDGEPATTATLRGGDANRTTAPGDAPARQPGGEGGGRTEDLAPPEKPRRRRSWLRRFRWPVERGRYPFG